MNIQGNSTGGNITADAGAAEAEADEAEEEEEAAEAEATGGVHLAAHKHKVTHLAQKVPKIPLAEVVGRVVEKAAAEKSARQASRKASQAPGKRSPLQRMQVRATPRAPSGFMRF